jgi:hypothetical protein
MTVTTRLFAVPQFCLPALAALAVAASGMTPVAAQAATLPDKTLVFCSEGSPAGFDTAQYTTSVEFSAGSYTVYNRLIEFAHGSTDIEPGLAEKWEVSPDGLTYTFYLRHGVKFQTTSFFKPTREFNADDVVFTYQRMLDPEQPFRKAYAVPFPYFNDLGLAKNIAKIEKIDPYTVRFTLKEVDAPFLQQIAMPFASILSAEYGDQLLKAGKASDINQYPVGTGPFIFRSYTKDDTIRFDGNPGQADLRDYRRSGRAPAKAETRRMSGDVVPASRRRSDGQSRLVARDAEPGGFQSRLYRVQHHEEAARQRTGAPRARYVDQQESDYRIGLPGRRADRDRPDAADAMGLRQEPERRSIRHRQGESAAEAGGLSRRFRAVAVGDAGSTAV